MNYFCLFQTADLFLQEKTNCGKNWNNVGSPQSILVERPAVRLYWVSIFQVRDKKNPEKIHELVVLV